MPPRNGPKDSKAFRQTTLLGNITKAPHSPSISPVKQVNRPTKSTSKKRSMKETPTSESSSDEISAIKMTPATRPIIIASSSDEEREPHALIPSSSSSKRRKNTRISTDSGSSNAIDSEHDANPTRKRLRKRHASYNSEGEEELSSERPRRLRRKTSPKESSSSEDVAQLAQEVDEERILNERFRTRTKTEYQLNLERLKKRKMRKSGEAGNDDTPEDEEQEDSDEEDKKLELELFQGSKPTGTVVDDDDDASDSGQSSAGFIVEDEESVQLPAEFSMETHEDLSHQFKKIFQFFVHVAIQKPQNRAKFMESQMKDEQYFSVPLQVTRRKISGLRDSLVSSSVWRPDFIKCLERYPEFETVPLDFAVPSCDACHLGGRMSKFLGRLNGSPYNQFGFEETSPNLSDEEPSHEFHLGRFCAKRTRVFHEFCHWEYSLFYNILRQIDGLRNATSSRTFHTVAFSGGKAPPEDLEDADGLCDWLDERRIVEMEWQKMKKMMESARHLDLDKRGDADD